MSVRGETTLTPVDASTASLREILDLAIRFEDAAHRVYTVLADRLGAEMRPLLLDLAAEELQHREMLEALAGRDDIEEMMSRPIPPLPTTAEFAGYIRFPDIGEDATEDDILAYAESREQIAQEHYAYLAELTSPGPVRALLVLLRDEERRHQAAVQTRWSRIYSIF